jgi:hypothetical protein
LILREISKPNDGEYDHNRANAKTEHKPHVVARNTLTRLLR